MDGQCNMGTCNAFFGGGTKLKDIKNYENCKIQNKKSDKCKNLHMGERNKACCDRSILDALLDFFLVG